MSAHRPTPRATRAFATARRTASALVALFALVGGASEDGDDTAVREDATRATNVLLVVVDTLRADRLGCYGAERPTSPRIDAFAAAGTRYANNRSQGPWTLPSMVSLMSGLYVTQETKALPTDRPVLAELVSEAGDETAAFVGNPVAGRARFRSRLRPLRGERGRRHPRARVDRALHRLARGARRRERGRRRLRRQCLR